MDLVTVTLMGNVKAVELRQLQMHYTRISNYFATHRKEFLSITQKIHTHTHIQLKQRFYKRMPLLM